MAAAVRLNNLILSYKHTVTIGQKILITFSFQCSDTAEIVVTGELKEQLQNYVYTGNTISNGAISISNDGTNVKLINSAPSYDVYQQGTFTFYNDNSGGGGGGEENPS